MHQRIRVWAKQFAAQANSGSILEVGSLDVNGCVRDIFPYAIRTDMCPGKNVDFICKAEDLPKWFHGFDTVISLDALEHMEDWRSSIRGMWEVLRPGGRLIMTMASLKKGRHNYPNDYWRADWEHLGRIFPTIRNRTELPPSIGWTAKKEEPLPDLDQIELIRVT